MRGNRTRALVTLYSTIENGKHRTTVMFAVSSAYSVLVEKKETRTKKPDRQSDMQSRTTRNQDKRVQSAAARRRGSVGPCAGRR